jgi:iron(III) transport system ATP-binding protein
MPNQGLALPLPVRADAETVIVRGLRKSFGATEVLRGVDLDVPAATVVALLGPSGCGKTTLLRCIAGLERPDAGSVGAGRRALSGPGVFVPPERRRVGMVFQDWALFPHLSVARNVGFGLARRERSSQRIDDALALVGLAGFAERSPVTLSGGQQQRVALARALANRPSVILLDEPFSNLDAGLRVQIRVEVRRLLADLGVTALFVTHSQEEAFVMGDRVAVMLDGRVVQQATPAELYRAPVSRAVAGFIGEASFVPGLGRGDHAETALGAVPLLRPQHGEVDVMLRPEELSALPSADGGDAVVSAIEFYGHDALITVTRDDGTELHVRTLSAPELRPGERVALRYSGAPTVAFARS